MSLAEKKVEKLLLNKDSSSEILSASEEEVQVDAFSCILREEKDYVLTKENREKLKNELKGVLISCREKKREQLREIWKEYRLGFLKKPITDIRTKNDFEAKIGVVYGLKAQVSKGRTSLVDRVAYASLEDAFKFGQRLFCLALKPRSSIRRKGPCYW